MIVLRQLSTVLFTVQRDQEIGIAIVWRTEFLAAKAHVFPLGAQRQHVWSSFLQKVEGGKVTRLVWGNFTSAKDHSHDFPWWSVIHEECHRHAYDGWLSWSYTWLHVKVPNFLPEMIYKNHYTILWSNTVGVMEMQTVLIFVFPMSCQKMRQFIFF